VTQKPTQTEPLLMLEEGRSKNLIPQWNEQKTPEDFNRPTFHVKQCRHGPYQPQKTLGQPCGIGQWPTEPIKGRYPPVVRFLRCVAGCIGSGLKNALCPFLGQQEQPLTTRKHLHGHGENGAGHPSCRSCHPSHTWEPSPSSAPIPLITRSP
jgi:hypothetical protein